MISMFLFLGLTTSGDIANRAPLALLNAGLHQRGMAYVSQHQTDFGKNDIVRSSDQRNVVFVLGSRGDDVVFAANGTWKYPTEAAQSAWRSSLIQKVKPFFRESSVVRKASIVRDGKIWREAVRVEEQCDGIGAAANFCVFQLDYASGTIIAGQVYNSAFFVHEAPNLTLSAIEKRLAEDGIYDEKRLTKRWLPFNYVYASRIKSSSPDLHAAARPNATVLVTIAEVRRGQSWSTVYFSQSGDSVVAER